MNERKRILIIKKRIHKKRNRRKIHLLLGKLETKIEI